MATPAPRSRFARWFLTGLLTLLPLWLTWVVVRFVFVLLSEISQPWASPLLEGIAAQSPQTLAWIDEPWARFAIALCGTVIVILLVGVLATRVVGQTLLRWFEALIARLPAARQAVARMLAELAPKYGVRPEFALAIGLTESALAASQLDTDAVTGAAH